MSDITYKFYENKFNNTKPIRGRAEEVRPLGKRRRDWEQITRKDLGQGWYAYCAKLYNTEVIEYHPNGDVVIRIDGWVTPTTAEFIHTHSPFTCFKQSRKLWVRNVNSANDQERGKLYPLSDKPLRFKWVGGHNYEPAEPVLIKKQVVNRTKAKQAREPVVPFLEWAKAFLVMSDGWVMHETRKHVLGWNDNRFADEYRGDDKRNYEKLLGATDYDSPESVYLDVLCRWAEELSFGKRQAETVETVFEWNGRNIASKRVYNDNRVSYEGLKRRVYNWVEKFESVHDIVEVAPTTKTMSKVI